MEISAALWAHEARGRSLLSLRSSFATVTAVFLQSRRATECVDQFAADSLLRVWSDGRQPARRQLAGNHCAAALSAGRSSLHCPGLLLISFSVLFFTGTDLRVLRAPRGLRGCKNRPAPFPGRRAGCRTRQLNQV